MSDPIDLAALARLCDRDLALARWLVDDASADAREYALPNGSQTYDERRCGRLLAREPAWVESTKTLLAEVTALRGEVERMRRDARFADAECNESSWLRESELDRLAETGSPSRRVLVDNRELAMLVAEARDHRLLRTQHERMRALDVEAAKAWRDASLDVEGQAWREQRALVAAIDALAKGEP